MVIDVCCVGALTDLVQHREHVVLLLLVNDPLVSIERLKAVDIEELLKAATRELLRRGHTRGAPGSWPSRGAAHHGYEAMEAGGREFKPRPGHYSRMNF